MKPPANLTIKTGLFAVMGVLALLGGSLAVYDLGRGINQATALYSVGVAGLSVEADLQSFTQHSRRTLIYALISSDPNLQIPFVMQGRSDDKRVLELHRTLARLDLDEPTRKVVKQLGQSWREYQEVRDEIISLILEGRGTEALELEQKDGAAHFESCAWSLQTLKEDLDNYAQNQLARVQQTYYRSAVEIGILVLMALLFVGVLFKLMALRQLNTELSEAELCERERNLVLQLVSEDKPLPEVLGAVQNLIQRRYKGSICAVRLVTGDCLTFGSVTELPAAYTSAAGRSAIDPPSCTCSLAVTRKKTSFTAEIGADPVWRARAHELAAGGIRSCLSAPICSASRKVLGTIALFGRDQHFQQAETLLFLEGAAGLAAVGIEQRLASDQLAYQATHDALTGLPNRLKLMEVLDDRVSPEKGQEWAVIWIDLDRFKPINDTYGHQTGDMLLHAVGGRLQNCVSENDMVARIGGDEFVVLLDAADTECARAVAATIVRALAKPFAAGSHLLEITGSVGIGHFPDDGATGSDLLRFADMAMYEAKRQGKNTARDAGSASTPRDGDELDVSRLFAAVRDESR